MNPSHAEVRAISAIVNLILGVSLLLVVTGQVSIMAGIAINLAFPLLYLYSLTQGFVFDWIMRRKASL